MWKTAAGTIAVAAVMALGGAANANDEHKPYESGEEKVEKQSGTEEAVDLKNIRGEHAKHLQQSLKDEGFYDGEVDGILGVRTQEALKKFQESKGMEASGKLDNQTASALGIEFSDIQPVRGTEPMEPTTSPTPMMEEEESVEPQSGTEGETEEVEEQSGTEAQAGESTSPVSGGETETQETEATSGETLGGEPAMGAVEEEEEIVETEIEPQAGYDKETIRKVEQALKDKNLFDGKVDGVIDAKTTEAIRRFQTDNGMTVTGKLDTSLIQALGVSTGAVSPTPGMETPAPTPME